MTSTSVFCRVSFCRRLHSCAARESQERAVRTRSPPSGQGSPRGIAKSGHCASARNTSSRHLRVRLFTARWPGTPAVGRISADCAPCHLASPAPALRGAAGLPACWPRKPWARPPRVLLHTHSRWTCGRGVLRLLAPGLGSLRGCGCARSGRGSAERARALLLRRSQVCTPNRLLATPGAHRDAGRAQKQADSASRESRQPPNPRTG